MHCVINQHGVACLIDTETRCREYADKFGGTVHLYVRTSNMTQPQFSIGDRVFSHYTKNTAAGVSGWGTIARIDTTYRDQKHGVTGSPLPDTTWYEVTSDEGATHLLDDAHGNWDMARIVPPHIAMRYGYGPDPKP
jgi:hypothetical protein